VEKFNTQDFDWIEFVPPSSHILREKIENMLANSGNYRAIVESLNRETGEYRILLQGKLEKGND